MARIKVRDSGNYKRIEAACAAYKDTANTTIKNALKRFPQKQLALILLQ